MSHLLDTYRQNILTARQEAERADLPNVRRRATEAAEVWDGLAARLEVVESEW